MSYEWREAFMLIRLVFASAAFFALTTGNASAFCSKPDAPSCASRYGAFDDEYDFNRCKRKIESYRSEVEYFLDCLKREGDEATGEFKDAVDSFNRRAR